ncbi:MULTISPECIES: pilus assembly protein TadG-related protein [unclassified Bradyrhizobium]
MRNLLRSRRGSVAFATVVALVPLIGVMALGAEGATWYVTRQQAQNAADAAAYSGGLWLACSLTSTCTADSQSMNYRGKELAAQNGFCNAGDSTSYPGRNCATVAPVSQAVTIASLSSWNGASGNFVQATVSQTEPTYLAQVLGLSSVTIGAIGVARVDSLAKPPCVLSLTNITFQGSPTVSSPTCGIAADGSSANAIGFVGNNGLNINAPSYTVGGCSQTGGSQCTGVQTYQQSVPDPLSALKTQLSALTTSNFTGGTNGQCSSAGVTSYESGTCYNAGNVSLSGTLSGTYYFNGNVTIKSSSTTVSGTATLILFGGATLTINGGPTIQLTGMKSPTGPSVLSSVLSLMTDLVIYDGESNTKNGINVSGSSTSYFNGTVYAPNALVNYAGNSTSSAPSPGCYQVIAYAVNFQGNTTLDNSKCVSDSSVTPNVQTVRLVQ